MTSCLSEDQHTEHDAGLLSVFSSNDARRLDPWRCNSGEGDGSRGSPLSLYLFCR